MIFNERIIQLVFFGKHTHIISGRKLVFPILTRFKLIYQVTQNLIVRSFFRVRVKAKQVFISNFVDVSVVAALPALRQLPLPIAAKRH